ncbi:MAG: nitroreductase family protein [Rubripirellula sp.]|nr:nitroreductase family protein [Rubripirellula sp.]
MSLNPVEHPVLNAIADRWSPYRFEPRVVESEKLGQCFEAARWAASSYNEQPWSFLLSRRENSDSFQRMLMCLMEANQTWAEQAGALVLTVINTRFKRGGKPNRVALHDLGQASAHFALQATALGLQVHQMGGVNLSKIRHEYEIPEGYEPQTALAVGYPDLSEPVGKSAEELKERESGPRVRLPVHEIVFGDKWGSSAKFGDSEEAS